MNLGNETAKPVVRTGETHVPRGSVASCSLYDRVLRDELADGHASHPVEDHIDVEWWELDRRALRKTTQGGRQIRVLLPIGQVLRDGAVLSDSQGQSRIRVCLLPCELLVILPRDAGEMGVLALELGNLHIPAEVIDGTVHVIADGPAEAIASDLGIPCRRQLGLFHPRRCAGMPELQISHDFRTTSR
jgi:urease accessory protein UreE